MTGTQGLTRVRRGSQGETKVRQLAPLNHTAPHKLDRWLYSRGSTATAAKTAVPNAHRQVNTFLARIANRLPAGCVWIFPDAVVVEACHLLRLESLAVEAEIEALDAEISANDGRIAELVSCLASLRAELG